MKRNLRPLAMIAVLAATATGLTATPAHAWKPRTHVYLAEQALKDATDNSKVTIYEADYRTGKVVGTLGEFPVDARVLAALRQNPKQYRAGVVGPDAYPDIATGQQIIHPNASHALDGHATAQGTNSWLTYLWDRAYGPQAPSMADAVLRQLPSTISLNYRNDTTANRAFVTGYLTHAAGDMFAHTFVNHFSGGEFMLQPDPRNALKHLILEGYIGKRTPGLGPASTDDLVSIDGGVSEFIYREMVRAHPGSPLEQKLFQGDGTSKSIPAIFSKLRNEIQKDITRYDNLLSGKTKLTPADNLWLVAEGSRIGLKKRWVEDIDKGLRAWPQFSHDLAKALVYNADGGTDVARAKALTSDYVKNYLVYMGPVPDFVIDGTKLMMEVIDKLTPTIPFLSELLAELKKNALDYIVRSATGRTLDEWTAYLKNPEQHFDPVMNAPGGEHPGRSAQRIALGDFNRDYLKLNDVAFGNPGETFSIEQFPPAFNTVQMSKIMLLGKDGISQLLDALVAKGCPRPVLPSGHENVMLGWLQSLDNDNQWQGLASRGANPKSTLIFAQNGGATYQRLFMKMVGEEEWVTAPTPSNQSSAPLTAAQSALLDRFAGEWQNVTTGPGGSVTMTFTRDGSLLRGTTQVRGAHTETLYPGAVVEARASEDGTRLEAEWWTPSDVAGYVPKRGTFKATPGPGDETFQGAYRQPDQGAPVSDHPWSATRKKATTPPATTDGRNSGGGNNANPGTGSTVPGTIPGGIGGGAGHRVGERFPIEITIRSLQYSVEPVNVGDTTIAPHADEKLLVVRYTMTNAAGEERHFDQDTLAFFAMDEENASHPSTGLVGLERSRREVGTDVDPGVSLDLYTVLVVPADGAMRKLIIEPTHSGEGKVKATIDLSGGKVSPLTAPFADPADASGATARASVPAETGTFYPMGFFDARLDSVKVEPGQLNAVFTVRNRSTLRQHFDHGIFLPTLRDAEGGEVEWDATIYHATKAATIPGAYVEPQTEYRIRFRFTHAEGVTPQKLSLGEHFGSQLTRAYVFPIATTGQ